MKFANLPRTRIVTTKLRLWLSAFILGYGLSQCTPYSSSEIACEEALAKLASCCGWGGPRGISCEKKSVGCEYPVILPPDIGVEIADCILRLSCDQIQDLGMCEENSWHTAWYCSPYANGSTDPKYCVSKKVPICYQ